jgi:hypothetical protein
MTHYVSVRPIGDGSADNPFRPPWSGQGPDWVMVGEDGGEHIIALPPKLSRADVDTLLTSFSGRYRGTDSVPLPVQDKRDPYNLPELKPRQGTETETWTIADQDGWTGIDQTWAKLSLSGTTIEQIVSNQGKIKRNGADGITWMYMSAHTAEDADLQLGSIATVGPSDPYLILRFNSSGPDGYAVKWNEGGTDKIISYKLVAGILTEIGSTNVPVTTPVEMRFAVTTEAGPVTRLQAKLWDVGSGEPVSWQVDFTNNDAALQEVAGSPGVGANPLLTNGRAATFDGLGWTNNDGGAPSVDVRNHIIPAYMNING